MYQITVWNYNLLKITTKSESKSYTFSVDLCLQIVMWSMIKPWEVINAGTYHVHKLQIHINFNEKQNIRT